jgi:hypothetical protein
MAGSTVWRAAREFLTEVEHRPHWAGTLDAKLREWAEPRKLLPDYALLRRCVQSLQEAPAGATDAPPVATQDDLFGVTPYPGNRPGAGRGGPDTSHAAAARVASGLRELQQVVLALYEQAGPATVKEIEAITDSRYSWGRTTVRARVSELEDMGYLAATDLRRQSCRVMEITPGGREALARHRAAGL